MLGNGLNVLMQILIVMDFFKCQGNNIFNFTKVKACNLFFFFKCSKILQEYSLIKKFKIE